MSPAISLRLVFGLVLSLLLSGAAGPAAAHDPGLSTLRVLVGARSLEATIQPPVEADDARTASPVPVRLFLDDRPMVPESISSTAASLVMRFDRPASGGRLRIVSNDLAARSPEHRQILRVVDEGGERLGQAVLDRGQPTFELSLENDVAGSDSITTESLVGVGAEHILMGFDHLLFLAVLLLGCRSVAGAFASITAFTAAHSLTLAAATLGTIPLQPAWVEPAIAGSIIVAAALNLASRRSRDHGPWLAFGFGLVHGLGFAGALESLGLAGESNLVRALFEFNLGVELGQLALALPCVALASVLARRVTLPRALVPVASSAIGLLGFVWLLERIHEV